MFPWAVIVVRTYLHKFVSLLFRILNNPRRGTLAKELHQPALHHEPQHSRKVEQHSQPERSRIQNHVPCFDFGLNVDLLTI